MPKNTQQIDDDGNRAAKKRRVTANPTDLAVSSTARPSAAEIRRILPRIATDKLHGLIVKNMLVGTGPISLADLEGVPKRPVEVRMNSRSIKRNGWNGLDPDLLQPYAVERGLNAGAGLTHEGRQDDQRHGG